MAKTIRDIVIYLVFAGFAFTAGSYGFTYSVSQKVDKIVIVETKLDMIIDYFGIDKKH